MKKAVLILSALTLTLLTFTSFIQAAPSPEKQAEIQARKAAVEAKKEEKMAEIEANKQERAELQEQKREEKKLEIQERQELREQKRATIEARLALRHQERIRTFWGQMHQRFQAAIARLERLIGRIEARIAIIGEDETIDTTIVLDDVETAKDILAEATAELTALNESIESLIVGSDDPKQDFHIVKDSVQSIKNQLIQVHRILVHVIGDIKGLRVGQTGSIPANPSAPASPSITNVPLPTTSPTDTPLPTIEPTTVPEPTAIPI